MIRIFGRKVKKETIRKSFRRLFFMVSIVGVLALIYDSGIRKSSDVLEYLYYISLLSD
ncbi:MAG: hypothetical protein JW731_04145 [Bacteroidales bacterium]|nr:hypothetical protein [Bacteroidales bacterium]